MSASLPLVNRIRIVARRVLLRALLVVPGRAVEQLHRRWIAATGLRRRLLRPFAALLFYRRLHVRTFAVPGGNGEKLCVAGSRMERELYWFGENGYEPAEAHWWRTLCGRSQNVLEIGANIGYYTVVGAAAAGDRYTAVEANPEAAAIARRNLELNHLADIVEVLDCAVVGDPATTEIELAFPAQEAHSVAPTGSWVPTSSEGQDWVPTHTRIRVPATAAGPLFAGRDLVKIDIEGAEADVLDAARDEIDASRPVLIVEVLPRSHRLQDLLGDLLDRDYLAFEVARPPRSMARAELDRSEMAADALMTVSDVPRDVLMVPAERAAVLN